MDAREQARDALRIYQARMGLSAGEVAMRMGYSRRTLLQFISNGRYGDGADAASRIMAFIKANPPEAPELPGKLYLTENVRIIDEMIAKVQRGHWALVYGPPATQKSFVFEYRTAEAFAASLEPSVIYVYAAHGMAPTALLKEIALGLGAYIGVDRQATLRNILYTLRRRKIPLALIVDEAQHLAKRLDTLEVLREVCDRGRIGLLIAGHDNVEDIFQPRPDAQLEQWRSRVEQHRRCLPGLSEAEARQIVAGELGALPERTVTAAIEKSTVEDTRKRTKYVSARRLFNACRDFLEKRGKGNGKVH